MPDRWYDGWTALREQISLEHVVYGNTVQRWLIALLVFLVAMIVLRIVKAVVARRAGLYAERSPSEWATSAVELIQATRFWFLLIAALFVGLLLIVLPERIRQVVHSVMIVTLLLQGAIWGNVIIGFSVARYAKRRMETDAAAATTLSALVLLGKLVLWSLVVLLILANVGVDVTALVAGLGIGGIAIALAAQNILGDLFASLSIVLDKPFVLGDFIIVGDQMGTVDQIGLKTTRLRSLSGEQLIFSNNDLLQSRIRNFKRMQERRILFTIGVTYQTPHEKVVAVPQMIREAVEAHEDARFDRAHFKEYGSSSLNFEVVYFVLKPDFGTYMNIQQAINLTLYQRFEQAGIDFAYPTQTVYLHRPPSPDDPGERGA